MSYSMNELYRTLGVSKQAVYQALKRQAEFDMELMELIALADRIKDAHPGCGVEKMYKTLQPKAMGRDKFCEIFLSLGYGVQHPKNFMRTTISGDRYFPNLIEGMAVERPYQVIQSDITYFRLKERFYYLVFIIDVYTRQIVGHAISDHLRTEANVLAMRMALSNMDYLEWGLIHHSDKGSQYSSDEYTKLLTAHQIHISMGDVAWENAFAERVNGIIKNEYLNKWEIKDFDDLVKKVKKAIKHYNTKRLHRAFGMKHTPESFFESLVSLDTRKRPTVMIYTEGRKNFSGAFSPSEVSPEKEPQAHICPIEVTNC